EYDSNAAASSVLVPKPHSGEVSVCFACLRKGRSRYKNDTHQQPDSPHFCLPFLPNSQGFIGMLVNAMSTVKTQIEPGRRVAARYWIFSPVQDMIFILFTPILILGAFAAARRGGWMNGLLAFALALATAHYLPGILRAYGDRALFRRFRVRLILAPLFLFTVTAAFAYLNLHIVLLLALLWGQWHWMMQ